MVFIFSSRMIRLVTGVVLPGCGRLPPMEGFTAQGPFSIGGDHESQGGFRLHARVLVDRECMDVRAMPDRSADDIVGR